MRIPGRAALLLAATAFLPMAHAVAADYDPPIYVEQPDEYVPVEVGNGWYLRGDIGYIIKHDIDPVSYRVFDPIAATYGDANFDTSNLDSDFTFGGGFGYRFSDWIRADATVDGFRAKFDGTTTAAVPCNGTVLTTCRSEDSSSVSAINVMANGYVDLGTYIGFTPYVGAGAGMTYLNWSGLDSQNFCVAGTGACAVNALAPTQNPGLKDWRFTYAFMAGAAYDLTHNLKVDVGYKYRQIDGGDMFGWDQFATASGATGVQGSDDGLTSHEIKVGLRYELW